MYTHYYSCIYNLFYLISRCATINVMRLFLMFTLKGYEAIQKYI